jgi:hypothetical protein
MLRLAQLALIAAMAQTRTVAELETEKAMLGMRLRIARLARDGAGTLTGKPVPTDAEIQALERELDAVSKDHMRPSAAPARSTATSSRSTRC